MSVDDEKSNKGEMHILIWCSLEKDRGKDAVAAGRSCQYCYHYIAARYELAAAMRVIHCPHGADNARECIYVYCMMHASDAICI